MVLRLLCSGLIGPPHGPLPATSWLRRPRPVPDPIQCVTPPSGWIGASPRWTPISAAWTCWFALVVDDGPTQLARISLSRTICPGLDQQVATALRRDPVVDCLSLLLRHHVLTFCGTGRVIVVGAVHVA